MLTETPSVTNAVSVLISALVVGIPLSLLVSDEPVTWSGLVRTLIIAGVVWSLGQLMFISIRAVIRALRKRLRTHRGYLKGITPHG